MISPSSFLFLLLLANCISKHSHSDTVSHLNPNLIHPTPTHFLFIHRAHSFIWGTDKIQRVVQIHPGRGGGRWDSRCIDLTIILRWDTDARCWRHSEYDSLDVILYLGIEGEGFWALCSIKMWLFVMSCGMVWCGVPYKPYLRFFNDDKSVESDQFLWFLHSFLYYPYCLSLGIYYSRALPASASPSPPPSANFNLLPLTHLSSILLCFLLSFLSFHFFLDPPQPWSSPVVVMEIQKLWHLVMMRTSLKW